VYAIHYARPMAELPMCVYILYLSSSCITFTVLCMLCRVVVWWRRPVSVTVIEYFYSRAFVDLIRPPNHKRVVMLCCLGLN
jgi:hypothetical protein